MISDELRIIAVFLCTLLGALYVLPKLAQIARRINLMDQPSERKVHIHHRPLVGGIGMVIATTFTSLIFIPISGLRGYFLGLSILLFIGFLDDFKEVGHKQKFLAQIVAVFLLIHFSNVVLLSFGNLLGIGNLNIPGGAPVIWLVTIFCVVGVINAINLIDGLDGLAGGLAFLAFIFFAIHASIGGSTTLMLLNFALAGAVLGFLKFNWYPSTMFMGDAGSLCLGFSLAYMALALTQGEGAVMPPVTALLILAVPITDTLIVMCKRVLNGSSPFKPDKYHLHHIFIRFGFTRLATVKIILAISFMFGSLSFLASLYHIPDYILFTLFAIYLLASAVASFNLPAILRYSIRLQSKMSRNKTTQGLFALLRKL